ncbi:hypothetical protein HPB49_007972 [Dermacentor silvarum]|uniref:Uncharacterized protein n=1 Tax=Dermacentor silvarum TaxID=543639 RepID=A0ACB8DXF3_DERSI|nr:hypothetical protein HPB49_007972 [Dermacentor silvarum]
MLDNWELPLQKVSVYVVTDNARNFRAALRGISCIPMQCMGHTLQLAIKDAKEETAAVPAILKEVSRNCWSLQTQCPSCGKTAGLPAMDGALSFGTYSSRGNKLEQ